MEQLKADIRDYNYDLPEDRIAQHPLEKRDASRLLIMNDGVISEDIFSSLGSYIPKNSLLVFNDTKVIRARLIFSKSTGATIEILCLEPIQPADIESAFHQTGSSTWNCLIGNVKRWKSGKLLKEIPGRNSNLELFAEKKEDLGNGCFSVEFTWNPSDLTFSEILSQNGMVPLPPYIHRAPEEADNRDYQTVYAKYEGSVAAPTAGLHFTDSMIGEISQQGIRFENVTLHVGLGTFRPVSSPDVSRHVMHEEKIVIKRSALHTFIENAGKPLIAVGTTSVRTLESLYWLGVRQLTQPGNDKTELGQWEVYEPGADPGIPAAEALKALENSWIDKGIDIFTGSTRLMIVPGYRYRLVTGLVTNFHLPQSTLLLLVSAFTGEDWKKAYRYALNNGFRFLSYGDACLFFPSEVR
ncbi:MAG: S-adenosylmethionine:tRNA ribosyltransferase-isomerase [Bacteroidota bacterium]|nr:S-adenosylmethionine:tRNA ribosyltransferase-isomerase [Bacteroidota bacterium]